MPPEGIPTAVEPVRSLDPSGSWGAVTYSGDSEVRESVGPTPPQPHEPVRRAHLAYAPGLDGVRALAVTAVVIFHLGASWLAGGFLGVDVFFTLSGFLITSILLTEFHSRGRIDVKNFYLRRARRLLPALYLLLGGVTLVAAVFARGELHRLRGDVVAALGYSTNWTQIFWNRSYFDQLDRPSLLQHLWSLAVEEQFYLLWPLILVACIASRRRWLPLAATVALTLLSTVLMAAMFHVGQDPARVYYGTDTHIAPMLLGAALAIVVSLRRQAGARGGTLAGRVGVDAASVLGLVGLVWAATSIDYYSPGLYRGGYLLVGLASGALILAAATAGTVTARLLSWDPLVWLGKRSYAIYLWHWPVLMLTRPGVDVSWPRPVLIPLQVAVILIASDLSFRYVEKPIRAHGFLAFLRGTGTRVHSRRTAHGAQSRPTRIGAITVTVVAAVAVTLFTAPGAPAGIQVDRSHDITIHVPSVAPHAPTPSPTPSATHSAPSTSAAPVVNTEPPFARPVRVSFFGDSQGMTLLLNKPNGLDGSISTSDSTVEGCGVLLGTIRSKVGFARDLSADCGNWPQLWAANAARNRPQIAVVELGAWDVFDDTVGGKQLRFGSPGWDAYFARQLATGIDVLTKAGAQVALMGVPCYRPIAAGGLPLLPERGYDNRTHHVTTLLEAAAKQNPLRVFMIHPPSQFCREPIASDVNYRWDGTHFYKPGAALTFQVITPQLLKIPQPPHH